MWEHRRKIMRAWVQTQNIAIYEELERLKRIVDSNRYQIKTDGEGWKDRGLDETYSRNQASPKFTSMHGYRTLMFNTFQEFLEKNLISNIDSETFVYLDIGCHPGGFTMAILKHNPKARGHGIALPEEEGGSSSLVSDRHKTRITIHLHDVTHFDLSGPLRTDPIPAMYIPLPFRTKFNLVILDAHRFGAPPVDLEEGETTRMILSQLLIALESIATNGIILMRLSLGQGDQMVAILYLFSLLFRTVRVHKPVCGHKGRGSFYAVADGFQGASLETALVLERILGVLRKQWWDASFGGEEGKGRWINEWWDEIVKSEDLPELFGMRYIDLITPVWETQIEGLKTHFQRNDVAF